MDGRKEKGSNGGGASKLGKSVTFKTDISNKAGGEKAENPPRARYSLVENAGLDHPGPGVKGETKLWSLKARSSHFLILRQQLEDTFSSIFFSQQVYKLFERKSSASKCFSFFNHDS